MSTPQEIDLQQSELTFVTELSMDYEAPLVTSILEAHQIPHIIQGLSHRGMVGVLGGGIVPLRLLVPKNHAEKAHELMQEYRMQMAQSLEDSEDLSDDESSDYVPRRRLFTDRGRRAGISLLLGAFIGFGTASLYARLYLLALPIMVLHILHFASSHGVADATIIMNSIAQFLSLEYDRFMWTLDISLTPLDMICALLWTMFRTSPSL